MTFYYARIYGSKIAGESFDMSAVIAGLQAADNAWLRNPEHVRNSNRCDECELTRPYAGPENGSALWHNLLVREDCILEILRRIDFKWTKKRGIGRSTPLQYIEKINAEGVEEWFTLELSEI